MRPKAGTAGLALGLGLLLSQGCAKLEEKLCDPVATDQYNFSSTDVGSLIGAAYAPQRVLFGNNFGFANLNDVTSDEVAVAQHPWGWPQGPPLHLHAWQAATAETGGNWDVCYSGINYCNSLLEQLDGSTLPLDATVNKGQLRAEISALRAFYYYVLCDMYGNVPIVTKSSLEKNAPPPQHTRAQVYQFIVQELTDTLPLLSANNDASTYGRFNKWAAMALLAKLYLNAEVYTGVPAWAQCRASCEAIISSGLFSLTTTQKENFVVHNEDSAECIYAVPFDQLRATGFNMFKFTMNNQHQATYQTLDGGGWGGSTMLPQFINSYDPADVRLATNHIGGPQKSAAGAPLFCEWGSQKGQPFIITNSMPSIYLCQETEGFREGKFAFASGVKLQDMSNDFPVFRYAEILLMKAEVQLRMGDASGAAQLVTQVRQRNFANPALAAVTATDLQGPGRYSYGTTDNHGTITSPEPSVAYGRFLDELGWEFEQEGHRRQDMIRFGVWTTKSWLSHSATNKAAYNLFPIPAAQLSKNNKLKQNPGY